MISNKTAWMLFCIIILALILGVIRTNIWLICFSVVGLIALIIIGWFVKRKR